MVVEPIDQIARSPITHTQHRIDFRRYDRYTEDEPPMPNTCWMEDGAVLARSVGCHDVGPPASIWKTIYKRKGYHGRSVNARKL